MSSFFVRVDRKKKFEHLQRFFLGLFLLFSLFSLSSCQSTNESESYMGIDENMSISCVYDETSNQTKVKWKTYIKNGTIYDIESFNVYFDCYLDGTKLMMANPYYDAIIKHGKTANVSFSFSLGQKIDTVEYNSWKASYRSFWDTYKVWFIVTISVVGALSLGYLIFVIATDFRITDLSGFFEDHPVLSVFLVTAIAGIFPIFTQAIGESLSNGFEVVFDSWVPLLIVLGGVASMGVITLLIHLIKYVIEEIADSFGLNSPSRKAVSDGGGENDFDPRCEKIEDHLNDKDALLRFSLVDLKNYCKENGIKGYSSLPKAALAKLIISSSGSNAAKVDGNKVNSSKAKKITFDDIVGLEEAKRSFREKVILPFEHPELFKRYGKKAGGGILLYGLPGTGKTMFAEASANELNACFIPVKCSDIKSKWYGESERNVKNIFERAKKASKAIIFFDEFEAIGAKRNDDRNDCNNELVPQILAEMQGIGSSDEKSTIMVIAATNKPWAIDSAFMRPGRFDERIYIPLPDFEARKALFKIQFVNLPLSEDLDFDYLAKITEGFNGADVKEVCEKLKMSAINRSLEKGEGQTIGMDDVAKVEKNIRSSVSQEDIERLREFEEGSLE